MHTGVLLHTITCMQMTLKISKLDRAFWMVDKVKERCKRKSNHGTKRYFTDTWIDLELNSGMLRRLFR